MSNSKNDLAWVKLFDKYKIIERVLVDGQFEISSTDINVYREARLMTKFDHRSQLPEIFAKNKLSILPTSRGGYKIGTFETFCNFKKDEIRISPIEFPSFLESIDYKNITSEATAINCSFVSRILHDFTEEESLFPTVSGRMGSSTFGFNINSLQGVQSIKIENSQVEIDGGYEGETSLNLIEAKNYISDDFLIRQLYYPFRLWNEKIQKKVRPIFLTYSNGIFHLREYEFSDLNNYNSISLIKHKKYVVQEGSFNLEVIAEILDTTNVIAEPHVPFPQADSFERIINLCELLFHKDFLSKEEITSNYDFDSRQTDYYFNAGKYLGLIENYRDPKNHHIGCTLSKRGKQIFTVNLIDRQKEFIKLIVSHSVFKKSLKLHLDLGEMPPKESIIEIMKHSNLYNVGSESTYFRRASTILGWINWIINQIEE